MKDFSFEIKIPYLEFSDEKRFRLKIFFSCVFGAITFFAWQNFDFTIFGALIFAYFGMALIWRFSGRISAFFALILLASCPVLLLLEKNDLAEGSALYAYYFLVITVVAELFALWRKS